MTFLLSVLGLGCIQQLPICTSWMSSINVYQPLLSIIRGRPEILTAWSQSYTFFHNNKHPRGNVLPCQCPGCICTWQCTTSNLSLLDKKKFTCHKLDCSHTVTYNKPLQWEITPGYCGTNLSDKIVRKGSGNAGSGCSLVCQQMIIYPPANTY
jgi:hypothetical protein